jgi:hypothetical protein
VGGQQIDEWMDTFIGSHVTKDTSLEEVGELLAERLGSDLCLDRKPWEQLRCGIHLAGYYQGLPRLWHVHCGHLEEPAHEPRLYRDYPEGRGWSDEYFRVFMFSEGGTASCHLRNGYTPHYALLHKHAVDYANSLQQHLGLTFPRDSLLGHLEFHKVLVRFVAGVLVAAGEHPGVNDQLSALAFDQDGLKHDELLPITPWRKHAEGLAPSYLAFSWR